MSSLPSTVARKQSSTGRGHDGTPPFIRGGGDDFRGDGPPDFGPRMRRARLGLLAALVPIFMLFLGIAAAYLYRHEFSIVNMQTGRSLRIWHAVRLPVDLLLFNTLVLLLSSLTMEMARRQIAQQAALEPLRKIPGLLPQSEWRFPWLTVGLLLGVAFLIGQAVAWHVLALSGFFMSGDSSAFVYVLTGTHAVHLIGGMVVFSYAQFATLTRKSIDHRRIVVDITAWYWHFMLVLWVCIFALLYFVR
jgi:cytochrome c oxidase subunit III